MIEQLEQRTKERILTGKVVKLSAEERARTRKQLLMERFKHESSNMRGYELIYPSNDKVKNANYEKLL